MRLCAQPSLVITICMYIGFDCGMVKKNALFSRYGLIEGGEFCAPAIDEKSFILVLMN